MSNVAPGASAVPLTENPLVKFLPMLEQAEAERGIITVSFAPPGTESDAARFYVDASGGRATWPALFSLMAQFLDRLNRGPIL